MASPPELRHVKAEIDAPLPPDFPTAITELKRRLGTLSVLVERAREKNDSLRQWFSTGDLHARPALPLHAARVVRSESELPRIFFGPIPDSKAVDRP